MTQLEGVERAAGVRPAYDTAPDLCYPTGRLRRYEFMSTLREIQSDIVSLSVGDYKVLRRWFANRDWETWDREFVEDAKSGRLDFLAEEAEVDRREARLLDL